MSIKKSYLLPLLLIFNLSVLSPSFAFESSSSELGRVVEKKNRYGSFFQYLPSKVSIESRLLVIAHGSYGKSETAKGLAKKFIERWTKTAEKQKVILIAPVFDENNFQSYGGYRGLFGRVVGADEFVNYIIRYFKPTIMKRYICMGTPQEASLPLDMQSDTPIEYIRLQLARREGTPFQQLLLLGRMEWEF